MSIITKETVTSGKKGDPIDGIILFKKFEYAETKNGDLYLKGNLQNQENIPYKIWGNAPAFKVVEDNAQTIINTVCHIKGEVDFFNDIYSINIKEIEMLLNEDIAPYLESKYDGDRYLNSLEQFCLKHLSPKGFSIVNTIFFGDSALMDRFKTEFAAASHHDNCKSGLIAHTCKVLKLAACVLSTYSNLTADENGQPDPNKRDLIYIGALLHDIGKIDEMKYGVYIEGSFVTHRIIGLEFILKHKDLFVQNYDEMWFKHLEAIIMQHHNEFGEPCRTVYSYIVHLVDDLDSDLSLMDQDMPNAPMTPAGKTIKPRDKRLNFY